MWSIKIYVNKTQGRDLLPHPVIRKLTLILVFMSAKRIQEENGRPEKVLGEFVMEERVERKNAIKA